MDSRLADCRSRVVSKVDMGKKSKAKQNQSSDKKEGQSSKQRCKSCKVFLKSADKGNVCPGCDGLYCGPCSTHQSRKCVGFHFCQNVECKEPGLCHSESILKKNNRQNSILS